MDTQSATPSSQTAVAASPARLHRHRYRTWRRVTGAALVATTLSATTLSATTLAAGAAVTSTPAPKAGVVLTDRGWDNGGWPSGDGQSGLWGSGSQTASADTEPASASESKGVVLIDTVLGYQSGRAAGTGVVLTSGGEVLTNYHVVQGATSIQVTVATTGQTYTATVVGRDQADDVALLQLAGASGLDTVAIDDDTVSTGDDVTAVGNAGGTSTLTAADGTVTQPGTTITTSSESGMAGETLDGLIETSADVVAGDSGGPLYDDEGEVIGIDTAASTGAEINGYAIPIDVALTVVEEIRSGDETSTVQIGASAFLGVEVSTGVSAGAGNGYRGWDADWSDAASTGAVVAGVVEDSPAAAAGLAEGDTITAIGGSTVSTADQVSTLLAGHEPGDSVKVTWTDAVGDGHTATVTLAASPVA